MRQTSSISYDQFYVTNVIRSGDIGGRRRNEFRVFQAISLLHLWSLLNPVMGECFRLSKARIHCSIRQRDNVPKAGGVSLLEYIQSLREFQPNRADFRRKSWNSAPSDSFVFRPWKRYNWNPKNGESSPISYWPADGRVFNRWTNNNSHWRFYSPLMERGEVITIIWLF